MHVMMIAGGKTVTPGPSHIMNYIYPEAYCYNLGLGLMQSAACKC